MKMWVGLEMEGKYIGKQTLFVETPYLHDEHIDTIIAAITSGRHLEGLYLGAGRIDVKQVCLEKFVELLKICWENGVVTTIECSNLNTWANDDELSQVLALNMVQVVVRLQAENQIPIAFLSNMVTKVDDNRYCYFSPFKCKSVTDLKTLEGAMFEGVDQLIYDNNKEES